MTPDNYEEDESIDPCLNCDYRLSEKCLTCKHKGKFKRIIYQKPKTINLK